MISGCGSGQLFGPTVTPTSTATATATPTNTPTPLPTFTPTPTASPTTSPTPSFVVLKSAIGGEALGIVVIRNTDTNGNELSLIDVFFDCRDQVFYVVDETGSRLTCIEVTDNTDQPNQIAMMFRGASSQHNYQLVIPGNPPIDIFTD
jgi:hypothetical protein